MIVSTPSELGAKIKDCRKEQSMTQGELASKTGLFQKDISKIELHTEKCNINNVFAVMAVLGLKMNVTDRNETKVNLPKGIINF
jgi:HTH-type transcriptional regulator / antitoxin HipB